MYNRKKSTNLNHITVVTIDTKFPSFLVTFWPNYIILQKSLKLYNCISSKIGRIPILKAKFKDFEFTNEKRINIKLLRKDGNVSSIMFTRLKFTQGVLIQDHIFNCMMIVSTSLKISDFGMLLQYDFCFVLYISKVFHRQYM